MQSDGPGPTASISTSGRMRSAYPPSWSVAVPRPYCPNRRAVNRVVATAEQRTILLRLYARVGDDPTREDLDEVVRETGLNTKWIRKWIARQRMKDPKGKSAKRRNSGSASGDLSSGLSPDSEHKMASPGAPSIQSCLLKPFRYSPVLPTYQPLSPDLAPNRSSSAAPGLKLTVFPSATGPEPRPLSSPGVSRSLDAGASGTPWLGFPLDATAAANANPLAGQPGRSFSVPFRSMVPQPYPNHAVDHCLYPGLQGFDSGHSTLRQIELDAAYMQSTATRTVSHSHPPGGPTPTQTTIAPQALYVSSASSDLTSGSQYLFNVLYEDSNANVTDAPPAAPSLSATVTSDCYLPALTRPLAMDPEGSFSSPRGPPVSMRPAHDVMPISYQMRLSDLVSATREARRLGSVSNTDSGAPKAALAWQVSMDPLWQPSPYGQAANLATMDSDSDSRNTPAPDLLYPVASTQAKVKVDPEHEHEHGEGQGRFPMDVDVTAAAAVEREEESEDEDEQDEAVTPCEEAHFILDLPSTGKPRVDGDARGTSIDIEGARLAVVGMDVEED